MATLETEIKAYEARRDELEKQHHGKFIVLKGQDLIGAYDTFEAAAQEAIRRFGRGPYLIRQVGAPPISIPASVMYRPTEKVSSANH